MCDAQCSTLYVIDRYAGCTYTSVPIYGKNDIGFQSVNLHATLTETAMHVVRKTPPSPPNLRTSVPVLSGGYLALNLRGTL